MFFAHDTMSVTGGTTRRLVSSSALPSCTLPLSISLPLTDGSLALPKRTQTG
jgi:hypothetical protein